MFEAARAHVVVYVGYCFTCRPVLTEVIGARIRRKIAIIPSVAIETRANVVWAVGGHVVADAAAVAGLICTRIIVCNTTAAGRE